MLPVHPVSLQAVCFQAFYCHISACKIQSFKERRVGIVSFHSCLLRPVFLPAPDPDRKVVFPFRTDAEFFLSLQRHLDIGPALHRRDQADPAVTVEKGQREQKPADELAADIARDLVFPRCQPARDRELISLFPEHEALRFADVFIDRERPCEQRPAPAQHVRLPAHEAQRDHKAERAAAFAAVEGRGDVSGTGFRDAARTTGKCPFRFRGHYFTNCLPRPKRISHRCAPVSAGNFSAQSPEAVDRGEDILREVNILDHARPSGEPGTDQESVRHAL